MKKEIFLHSILIITLCACNAIPATDTISTKAPLVPTYSPFTPEKITLSGYYTQSFEVSSFVPCSMNAMPKYGSGYWLVANQETKFDEKYWALALKIIAPATPGQHTGVIVFVRFVGYLSPPVPPNTLGYGHLNQYSNEIRVIEVIEMAPPLNPMFQCRD